jgi:tetratricopeptide (TPR) repeat protein
MNTFKNISLILAFLLPLSFVAQNDSKYGETEDEQIRCKEALSVYKSYKKQKNYAEAYQQWEKACVVCPEKVQESLYSNGAIFIKSEIKGTIASGDMERKAVLVDSLMWVYDKRMELFPTTTKKPNNRCHVLGRKASDYYRYFKDSPEIANDMFKETIDCLKANSSASTLSGYYVTSFYTMKAVNKEDKEAGTALKVKMLTDYLMLIEYINEATANAKAAGNDKTLKGYERAKANIEKTFIAIAKCDEMVPVLQASIEANPEDFELKKKVLSLLTGRECTENDLFLPVATAVYEIEPSAEAAFAIGMGYAKQTKLSESFKYMEEAVSRCDSCSEQLYYLSKTGQIASALKKSTTAKRYARQILAIDPDNAEAYMLIGDAIAGSSGACNDGALGKRAVYWVAHDYYARAKRMDPELTEKAQTRMNKMSKQFPTIDEVFTLGLQAGQSFTVKTVAGCPCSGESTTIRVR